MAFLEDFNGDSRKIQVYLKEVCGSFKGVLGCFQDVLWKFPGYLTKVSSVFEKKFKNISGGFQECFNEVLFCNFVPAWISL